MEMRASDVDSNDWMEAFDEWQREVLRNLLVTFGVAPPDAYVAAVRSGAAAGERTCRTQPSDSYQLAAQAGHLRA
jgi:hypothetical protein